MAWTANQSRYISDLLRRLHDPNTKANRKALAAWAQAEGGSAKFNPFNTTQGASGASSYNSVGVRNYTSYQQGLNATVQTLKNGRYGNILAALHQGNNAMKVANAIEASPWGTGGLVKSVLGGGVSDPGASGADPFQQVGGGKKRVTKFDPAIYQKVAAASMLQQAVDSANGVQPQGGPLDALAAAKQAATVRVSRSTGGASPGAPGGSAAGGAFGARATHIASKALGVPYVWGGTSMQGFDCSGLTQWVYKSMGINLPRTAAEQGRAGRAVPYAHMKKGDLLVAKDGSHVVMYAGGGRVIAAPHTGAKVMYEPVSYFPPSTYHVRRVR